MYIHVQYIGLTPTDTVMAHLPKLHLCLAGVYKMYTTIGMCLCRVVSFIVVVNGMVSSVG